MLFLVSVLGTTLGHLNIGVWLRDSQSRHVHLSLGLEPKVRMSTFQIAKHPRRWNCKFWGTCSIIWYDKLGTSSLHCEQLNFIGP
jgi:hypothetical protein